MAMYVSLIQFTEQGIRNIKKTIKRGDAAMAEAEKMGVKIVEEFWTMGTYDVVVVVDAPNDETMGPLTWLLSCTLDQASVCAPQLRSSQLKDGHLASQSRGIVNTARSPCL